MSEPGIKILKEWVGDGVGWGGEGEKGRITQRSVK